MHIMTAPANANAKRKNLFFIDFSFHTEAYVLAPSRASEAYPNATKSYFVVILLLLAS